MATISEDYVSFETAKLLKEKGFDCVCKVWYSEYTSQFGGEKYTSIEFDDNNRFEKGCKFLFYAPTLQMAMKWLREVHGLHISLEPCYDYDSMHVVFLAFVQNVADVHEFIDGRKNVASYPNAEKSYELAIKYCLENLI